jgi:hypothetical protein
MIDTAVGNLRVQGQGIEGVRVSRPLTLGCEPGSLVSRVSDPWTMR